MYLLTFLNVGTQTVLEKRPLLLIDKSFYSHPLRKALFKVYECSTTWNSINNIHKQRPPPFLPRQASFEVFCVDQETIQTVKEKWDFFKLVSSVVKLKPSGNNFVGSCPFHNDENPSFSINNEKKLFHCFACGAAGDIISFVMRLENLTFTDAVKKLQNAAVKNDSIHQDNDRKVAAQRKESKKTCTVPKRKRNSALRKIKDALSSASDFYHQYLRKDTERVLEARMYLLERGFSESLIHQFQIGYAPLGSSELVSYLLSKGFSSDVILESGLGVASKYGTGLFDTFRDRIVVPLRDHEGQVIAFGGRVFPYKGNEEGQKPTFGPKYLNSSETRVFKKSEVLFGAEYIFQQEEKPEQVVIVEGYFDVLTMHQAGIWYATASLGTALSLRQIEIAAKLSKTKKVVLNFDNDIAGHTAACRTADHLLEAASRRGIQLFIALLPEGVKDADEFIRLYSATDYIQRVLKNAIPLVEWRAKITLQDYDGSIESRTRCIEILGNLFSKIGTVSYRSHLAHYFAEQITQHVEDPNLVVFTEDQILRIVRNLRARRPCVKHESSKVPFSSSYDDSSGIRFVEEFFLRIMIHFASVRQRCTEVVYKGRFRFSDSSLWDLWKWLARNGLETYSQLNAEKLSIALEAEEAELYQRHAHLFSVDEHLLLEVMDPEEAVESSVVYMQRLEREDRCKRLLTRWKEIGDEMNNNNNNNNNNNTNNRKNRLEICKSEQESIMEAVKAEREALKELKDMRRNWIQQILNNAKACRKQT
ncbi:DNA primase [Galdieria sulphuraria]|nr:DNA primase [Galdieria sulphuraria]